MKRLLLITYVDFWKKGSGHRTRINTLVNSLKYKVEITVYFAGCENGNDRQLLSTNFPEIRCEFAGAQSGLSFKEYKEKFSFFISDKYFDFALIEYLELSSILIYLPDSTITILDTHDVINDRIKSFKKYNLKYDGIMLTQKEELQIYHCYDYIIIIQNNDFESISKKLDPKKLLLVPHSSVSEKIKIRKTVSDVGYVASSYLPNVEALNWFINNVWDMIWQKHGLRLNVYGNINDSFSLSTEMSNRSIFFHGLVDDLESLYNNVDIIINPIRCGAGLKIKNVEALSHGLPLITSDHGASGIEDGAPEAFLVANEAKEYLLAFNILVENYGFRRRLSNNAFKYARLKFSEEKCYADIFKILN